MRTEASNDAAFRDALLAAQPLTPALRERYQKELNAMFETKLTPRTKFLHAAGAVASFLLAALGATVLIRSRGQGATLTAIWSVYTVGCLAWGASLAATLRRGSFDARRGPWQYSKWSVAATLLIVGFILAHALRHPSIEALVWCVFGAMWFTLAIGIEIRNRIVQAEMLTREKFLSLEYRLIELSERLGERPG